MIKPAFEFVFAFSGIPSFQIFGTGKTKTKTREFILDPTRTIDFPSVEQKTLIQEGDHLLRYKHSFFLSNCYIRIPKVKERKHQEFLAFR
ncbi:hypothetical protein [Leptospira borgpetersenii]|uniref:hypothetical protein n=1 Tax=Leptospira borgpetersenii TaxID=174 RepID=UPI00187FBDD6|nr:hypothetical protein [Leptospira borgpetersenii serovar Balcanica]